MTAKRKTNVDQLPLTWQPQVGDRVTLGSETVYTITRASENGSDVDLHTPGTNLYRYRVPIDDLKPVDPVREPTRQAIKPAKESVDIEAVLEHLANAQHSSIDQFSGDIAILKKYLKSKGVPTEAAEELDRLCKDTEDNWGIAVAKIAELLEE